MSIRLVTDNGNADYQAVADILDHFGLSHFDAYRRRAWRFTMEMQKV